MSLRAVYRWVFITCANCVSKCRHTHTHTPATMESNIFENVPFLLRLCVIWCCWILLDSPHVIIRFRYIKWFGWLFEVLITVNLVRFVPAIYFLCVCVCHEQVHFSSIMVLAPSHSPYYFELRECEWQDDGSEHEQSIDSGRAP